MDAVLLPEDTIACSYTPLPEDFPALRSLSMQHPGFYLP
jgi:hypothetical protein